MSEKLKPIADLTTDWPEETGNADLARFGNDLFANRPQLPQIAMDRIQVRMRQAIGRHERARKLRRWFMGLLLCAAIAVVGVAMILRGRGGSSDEETIVRDQFRVETAPNSPGAPDKAPIDLNAYKDLFGGDTPGSP